MDSSTIQYPREGGPYMARVFNGRSTAHIEGDFVVFLIGMRFNKPWKVHKWWIVFSAMPRMLKELYRRPECGFLGAVLAFTATGPLGRRATPERCRNRTG
jgi:hypothetical protein